MEKLEAVSKCILPDTVILWFVEILMLTIHHTGDQVSQSVEAMMPYYLILYIAKWPYSNNCTTPGFIRVCDWFMI